MLKLFLKQQKGMAMVIVLAACFVVLVTVGVGASIIANNLEKLDSSTARSRAEANSQSGLERVRGFREVDGHFFDACSEGDCIDTLNGGCGNCATTIYSVGGNRHKVRIQTLTLPSMGEDPHAGTISLLSTGYYKNIKKDRSSNMCLDYCTVAGYNCGSDGCGGICGTCSNGETCTGGICSGPGTSCSDITKECDDACVEGDTCGGGTVINAGNNSVAILGGCNKENGAGCGAGIDERTAVWDNGGSGDYQQTNANDYEDGQINAETLRGIDMNLFDAVRFCDNLSSNGFDDWYLPSQKETDRLREAKDNNWATNFADGCYWSSTEQDSASALFKDFSSGGCALNSKGEQGYTRCIRRY